MQKYGVNELRKIDVYKRQDDEIVIEIGMGRHESKEEVFTTFDGADTVALTTGDKVTVRRSEASTKIMKLSKVSFLETLRRKMKGN